MRLSDILHMESIIFLLTFGKVILLAARCCNNMRPSLLSNKKTLKARCKMPYGCLALKTCDSFLLALPTMLSLLSNTRTVSLIIKSSCERPAAQPFVVVIVEVLGKSVLSTHVASFLVAWLACRGAPKIKRFDWFIRLMPHFFDFLSFGLRTCRPFFVDDTIHNGIAALCRRRIILPSLVVIFPGRTTLSLLRS